MKNIVDNSDGIAPVNNEEQMELRNTRHLIVDYELVKKLQEGLISRATGNTFDNEIYTTLRNKLVQEKGLKSIIPQWVIDSRDLNHFWSFIKKIEGYQKRRDFIYDCFGKLLEYYEEKSLSLINNIQFGEPWIHQEWQKAMERQSNDPEAAITTARSLLETTFKYILDESNTSYDEKEEINDLYKKVTKLLNMSPSNHKEPIFKQILSGVNSVILGLAGLRNVYGDSHGKSSKCYKPKERHSELAVNLSGSVSMFLYKTYNEMVKQQ